MNADALTLGFDHLGLTVASAPVTSDSIAAGRSPARRIPSSGERHRADGGHVSSTSLRARTKHGQAPREPLSERRSG